MREFDVGIVTNMILGSSIYVIMENVVKSKKPDLGKIADQVIEVLHPGAHATGGWRGGRAMTEQVSTGTGSTGMAAGEEVGMDGKGSAGGYAGWHKSVWSGA